MNLSFRRKQCEKSHYSDCIALKACLWHNFEMAKFPLYALSGYNKALGIFYKLFVAGKAMGIKMNKNQFLNEFYSYLGSLSNSDKADIMRDFDEHFREGAAAGKTEEQICFELGSPFECARQYVGESATANQSANKPSYPAQRKSTDRKKYFWAGALIINIIEAVISLPLTLFFFVLGTVLIILDFYLIPLVSFVPFTVLAISLTLSAFLATIISLVSTVYSIKVMITKIKKNGEV